MMRKRMEDMKRLIRKVLLGCPGRAMDKESLRAACMLLSEIEDLQATVRRLQRGEVLGSVDADGAVTLRRARGTGGWVKS